MKPGWRERANMSRDKRDTGQTVRRGRQEDSNLRAQNDEWLIVGRGREKYLQARPQTRKNKN